MHLNCQEQAVKPFKPSDVMILVEKLLVSPRDTFSMEDSAAAAFYLLRCVNPRGRSEGFGHTSVLFLISLRTSLAHGEGKSFTAVVCGRLTGHHRMGCFGYMKSTVC